VAATPVNEQAAEVEQAPPIEQVAEVEESKIESIKV